MEHPRVNTLLGPIRFNIFIDDIPKINSLPEVAVNSLIHTLSDLIGKVVASHAEVPKSIPGSAETAPIHTMHEALRGYWQGPWYYP